MIAGSSRRAGAWSLAWSVVLTGVVLGPLLHVLPPGGGHLLLRDAVSTPRSYLTDSALGLSDSAARAVPQDAVVSVATSVVDGGVVVVGLLALALIAAGWGAAQMTARVLGGASTGPRLVAATVAVWNPYVAERLLQGHWSLLVGYAALPWTAVAAMTLRDRGDLRSAAPLVLVLGIAGLTPTGVLLCAVLAAAVLAAPGGEHRVRRLVVVAVATVVLSLPWLVATAVSGAGTGADPAGVAAFAARAEPGLGTIGALAGLGGIWNADAVPGSRTSLFAVVGTAVLLGLAAAGLPRLRRTASPVVAALLLTGAVSVVLVALAATPIGLDVGRWAAESVPGAGLFRDGQKWVALWMPALALSAGSAVDRPGCSGTRPRLAAVSAVAALLVVLPDLAWGVHGALRPVDYPAGWSSVIDTVGPSDALVAVLPTGTFRRFDWSGEAPVLDPAPRLLDADVLGTGDLPVGGTVVRGENTVAGLVERLLLDGAPASDLAALGVGWILIERSAGESGDSARTLAGLEPVYADADLTLYSLADPAPRPRSDRLPAIVAHLLWAAAVLTSAAVAVAGARHTRTR
ncbi:hypothetical protein HQ325_12190 [Rhodococcus sp. BP-349]|uniref:hypothetical protein n=1 Tax=unclassified Rhodococcus (in: high G+C Gram-positive bacteria) TaxID=192944 RepID=UPI001C9B8F2B|nr:MULTISPECIES: hypothetical protein [unclassified Rhodococcus (in: high G+C Gram-positive bacteria)]MBY6539434.1 hypothetical protein [Rhodococcus sp. BP-363]MBY6544238.1 hypothetical protein [Rhodococcus sp. BP-369]MBY6563468.1 hypothetical protein [Rhodococcus sp. BP-370]MBY6577760.1 hypothetical protein [Rhodococcus sp. BP-364]MBY6587061.1 hypothetical protein [Rhodococcus sp. BP-358]